MSTPDHSTSAAASVSPPCLPLFQMSADPTPSSPAIRSATAVLSNVPTAAPDANAACPGLIDIELRTASPLRFPLRASIARSAGDSHGPESDGDKATVRSATALRHRSVLSNSISDGNPSHSTGTAVTPSRLARLSGSVTTIPSQLPLDGARPTPLTLKSIQAPQVHDPELSPTLEPQHFHGASPSASSSSASVLSLPSPNASSHRSPPKSPSSLVSASESPAHSPLYPFEHFPAQADGAEATEPGDTAPAINLTDKCQNTTPSQQQQSTAAPVQHKRYGSIPSVSSGPSLNGSPKTMPPSTKGSDFAPPGIFRARRPSRSLPPRRGPPSPLASPAPALQLDLLERSLGEDFFSAPRVTAPSPDADALIPLAKGLPGKSDLAPPHLPLAASTASGTTTASGSVSHASAISLLNSIPNTTGGSPSAHKMPVAVPLMSPEATPGQSLKTTPLRTVGLTPSHGQRRKDSRRPSRLNTSARSSDGPFTPSSHSAIRRAQFVKDLKLTASPKTPLVNLHTAEPGTPAPLSATWLSKSASGFRDSATSGASFTRLPPPAVAAFSERDDGKDTSIDDFERSTADEQRLRSRRKTEQLRERLQRTGMTSKDLLTK